MIDKPSWLDERSAARGDGAVGHVGFEVQTVKFNWEFRNGRWLLSPSPISVVEVDSYWVIHVGDRPMTMRYSSEQGAKLDAWEWAKSRRKALFGAYRIELVDAR